MSLDLSGYDRNEYQNCLTARDVTRHADLYTVADLSTDNRAVAAHLLDFAAALMAAAQRLTDVFLTDGYDPSHTVPDGLTTADVQPGLTETERLGVLRLASTCAHNAALFLQEAQRRRVTRDEPGWDPITNPIAA